MIDANPTLNQLAQTKNGVNRLVYIPLAYVAMRFRIPSYITVISPSFGGWKKFALILILLMGLFNVSFANAIGVKIDTAHRNVVLEFKGESILSRLSHAALELKIGLLIFGFLFTNFLWGGGMVLCGLSNDTRWRILGGCLFFFGFALYGTFVWVVYLVSNYPAITN